MSPPATQLPARRASSPAAAPSWGSPELRGLGGQPSLKAELAHARRSQQRVSTLLPGCMAHAREAEDRGHPGNRGSPGPPPGRQLQLASAHNRCSEHRARVLGRASRRPSESNKPGTSVPPAPCVGTLLLFPMFCAQPSPGGYRVLCKNEQRLWPTQRRECSSRHLVPACRVAHLVLAGSAACTRRTKCAAAARTTRVSRDAGGLLDCRVLPLCSGHHSR